MFRINQDTKSNIIDNEILEDLLQDIILSYNMSKTDVFDFTSQLSFLLKTYYKVNKDDIKNIVYAEIECNDLKENINSIYEKADLDMIKLKQLMNDKKIYIVWINKMNAIFLGNWKKENKDFVFLACIYKDKNTIIYELNINENS